MDKATVFLKCSLLFYTCYVPDLQDASEKYLFEYEVEIVTSRLYFYSLK